MFITFGVVVSIFVPQPYNLVEKLACPLVVNLGVDYLGDFVFWFSVNNYRCWQRFGMLQKGVGCGWFDHRDIEHQVNSPHGI